MFTIFYYCYYFAAKQPIGKTKENMGKQKKTKNFFSCFCSVYFPLVSEKKFLTVFLICTLVQKIKIQIKNTFVYTLSS